MSKRRVNQQIRSRLANGLRKRIALTEIVPKKVIRSLSDDEVYDAYLTCPKCSEKLCKTELLLQQIIIGARTAVRFSKACDMLLAIHAIEAHGQQVTQTPDLDSVVPVTAVELKQGLADLLGWSIFELALRWAEHSFDGLLGRPYSHDELETNAMALLRQFPGISNGRWLFVYSPTSVSPLFEMGGGISRHMVASAKLVTVSTEGGMLFGADFSQGLDLDNPETNFSALHVCKPISSKS